MQYLFYVKIRGVKAHIIATYHIVFIVFKKYPVYLLQTWRYNVGQDCCIFHLWVSTLPGGQGNPQAKWS